MKKNNISENLNFELAKDIISRMIAVSSKNGFDPNDEITAKLLYEEKEINNLNEDVIDFVIKTYAPILKEGGFDD